jgi:hypothetical protein
MSGTSLLRQMQLADAAAGLPSCSLAFVRPVVITDAPTNSQWQAHWPQASLAGFFFKPLHNVCPRFPVIACNERELPPLFNALVVVHSP